MTCKILPFPITIAIDERFRALHLAVIVSTHIAYRIALYEDVAYIRASRRKGLCRRAT